MNEADPRVPRVLAVLVTHEGRPWLSQCLQSLAGQDYPELEVLVVDNASTYRVSGVVRKMLPEGEFLRFDQNLGFGAAANRALELSEAARQADYFLFLHDDTALAEDCVSRLVTAALHTEAGVVGAKALDWDDPRSIVEVGMSADQFGYPFTGLEEGEIDQGQHDVRRECLYASNACVLIDRKLVEITGSWDGEYFAFGEDLDLCIRARLAGFRVFVEPRASYRHAVALANRKRDTEAANRIRYYTRRNRLRTIAKDAVGYRVAILMFFYGALSVAEMLIMMSLRRFEELPAYPRALRSFVVSIPDVVRRRRAVQKRRLVPDRHIRRLMVSDLDRARTFFERRLREWEYETVQFGAQALSTLSPRNLKAVFINWVRNPMTAAYLVLGAVVLFALRNVVFTGTTAAGGLWPFPEDVGDLLSDYLAGWRHVGLGTESAAPPHLPVMWAVSVLAMRSATIAQSVLVVLLVALGLVGVDRLVARRTSFGPARAAAVALYGLGPVTRVIVERADLGAMALFAGLPWFLALALRMLGPIPGDEADLPATPPHLDYMVRDALKLAGVTALVVAVAPSSMVALMFVWGALAAGGMAVAWDRSEARRRATWIGTSFLAAALLLLPWSLEALRPQGAILAPVFSELGGGVFGPLWAEGGFFKTALLNPEGGWLGYLIPATVLLGALTVPRAGRRREARLVAAAWLFFALIAGLVARGWSPAPVTSSAMWWTVPLLGLALNGAHLAAGLREELPRHSIGWRHIAAFLLLVAVTLGAAGSFLVQLGDWRRPATTLAGASGDEARSVLSFFTSTSEQVGEFRVLWLGDAWIDPIRSGIRAPRGNPFLVTRPEGLTMRDLHMPPPAEGNRRLDELIDALLGRRLHLAGHLLAPAGIRYLVVAVDDDVAMSAMARQRDIALQQQQGGVAIFENSRWVPRVVLAAPELTAAANVEADDPAALMLAEWRGGWVLPRRDQAHFSGDLPRTRHDVLLVGDNFNPGWEAWVGDLRLEHRLSFGWANLFDLSGATEGHLTVRYADGWKRLVGLLLQATLIVMAVVMIRSKRVELPGWLR